MILKHKIKESLRALFAKGYIHKIEFADAIKMVGADNIKNFIQIGSNDGLQNDPINESIRKYNWRGILVEADSGNFTKLVKNYTGVTNLQFENVGIGPKEAEMTFYKLKDIQDYEPGWYNQIGSFDKATFIKNVEVVEGLTDRILEVKIPIITFEQLLNKYNLRQVDLLHIDTEGYDYEILKSVDLKKYKIKIILFESEWMTQFELRHIINYLRENNYKIFHHDMDHVGIKRDPRS